MNSKIVNIMGLFFSVVVFTILISSLVKSVKRIKIGNQTIEKTESRISKAEAERDKLNNQLQVSLSDEYFEKELRNKLGLAKDGETILVLPDPAVVKRFSPQIPEDVDIKPKSNLEKWIDLFR